MDTELRTATDIQDAENLAVRLADRHRETIDIWRAGPYAYTLYRPGEPVAPGSGHLLVSIQPTLGTRGGI